MNALAKVENQSPLDAALIKAAGLDRLTPEQRTVALGLAERYGLDLMLRHLLPIDGRPYITRDGLLHVAHRSGQFDGIEVTDPVLDGDYWRCKATVYRKDMSRGITYPGRYPRQGGNQKYAPEMAIKVAEVMALRRAFDVAAPVVEERWDLDETAAAPVERTAPVPLAAKAASRRAAIEARIDEPVAVPASPAPEVVKPPASGATDEPVVTPARPVVEGRAEGEAVVAERAPAAAASPTCGSPNPYGDGGSCTRPVGHAVRIYCTDGKATWPRPKEWK